MTTVIATKVATSINEEVVEVHVVVALNTMIVKTTTSETLILVGFREVAVNNIRLNQAEATLIA